MSASTFPGGTSISRLDVYDTEAPDGCAGGTPHLHLVSTEAYVVTAGRGTLQTLAADGFHETPLAEGSVVWFTPGTIHRAVNLGGLKIVVLMSNAGLPEAGDAIMTFPPDLLKDQHAYAAAASLGGGDGRADRAHRRRDLAVEGFGRLRDAYTSGDARPLQEFYAAAGTLVRDRAAEWDALIDAGPLRQVLRSRELAQAVAVGDVSHLAEGRVMTAAPSPGERAFGMCGRLRTYEVGARGGTVRRQRPPTTG